MTRPAPGSPGGDLASLVSLDRQSDGSFTGRPHPTERRIFGGLLMSQALGAAASTVDADRPAHSLHANFLEAGDGRQPVRFEVEVTRDGGSFSSRRVIAAQNGRPLLVAVTTFHAPEPGPEYEAGAAVEVSAGFPPPDGLPVGRYDTPWFESRDVPIDLASPQPPHARRAWFRPRRSLPDDPILHTQALVYLSDHGATRALRQPHIDHPGVERRMSVTLDHTIWLHRPVRVDQWLLSEFHPVVTGAGRGLALGSVRTAEGALVATLAQEALLRLPDD
jgi:acyl-CoA thioesterase II